VRRSEDNLFDFLGELPRSFKEGEMLFVHGSARRPLDEYVFPEDIYNPLKLKHIFELVTRLCFQGHTHIPGVFTIAPEFVAAAVGPGTIEVRMVLPSSKAMINVGSVGQPRDNDPRACYVIVEDFETVRYRRIKYDNKGTSDKIYKIPELDNFLGDRLLVGR
jgi:predicted phosphodiesterase